MTSTRRQITLADLKPGLVFYQRHSTIASGLVVNYENGTLTYYWGVPPFTLQPATNINTTEAVLKGLFSDFPDKPKRRL